ncbi:MAG: diguanylate cyclase, partial [Pseudomonadota bacterium]
EDDRQRIWIGTDRGLSLIDRAHDHVDSFVNDPTDPGSLGDDSIFSMFQDRGGLLWIGTRSAGLSKWNPRSWSFGHYRPSTAGADAFGSANVTSFSEDASGDLWLGTFGGGVSMLSRDRQSATHITKDASGGAGLPDDRVMTLLTDRQDHVWAGTMTGGLVEIDQDGDVVRIFQHESADARSIAANGIMSLHEDRRAQIWAGTFGGGISRLNPATGEIANFPHDPGDPTSLSNPRATAIAEDRSGTIWVGTDGGGLSYFDATHQNWRHLRQVDDDPNSLSANTIYALHVDRQGRLWAGTRNGLDEIIGTPEFASATGDITVRPVDDGPGTAIYGIESDYAGHLWLSTSQGIFNYNPDDGTLRMFNESHGLQGNEFNTGAAYTGMGGQLYFGGANGFNAFVPSELDLNATPPPVVLTSVSVANESYSRRVPLERIDGLELGFRDYVVTFGIAALDFTAPQQNRYAYRLEGLDTDWVDAGTERRITYTNLEGGNYVLHVRAMNSDGFWNEAGISIPIQVDHAPWKTWWAYSLYGLAAALLLFLFWRHNEKKLQRELEYSSRLEAEVKDRTKLLDRRNQDLKDVNQKLVEASTTDVLTGLRNRRYMFENIDREIELVLRHYRDGTETLRPDGNNDLLFLMVDLDNFKPVNDNCGHEAGDALLLQVRDVLIDACRKSDDIIRWGGDEFLIVARETNREYAAHLAERIRAMLSQRVFSVGEGQVARVTSSIGYASFPFIKDRPDLLGWEEVLGVADSAMYEAKEKKNAWVGIEGIAWDGTGDDLYRELRTDPAALAESGNIAAVESLEDVGQASA